MNSDTGGTSESDPPVPPKRGKVIDWLDHRTGIRGVMHEALDEPIPGGARLAYVFGSGLLFLFLSQVITGVFLAFYYVPSPDHAHTTVVYIAKEVMSGSFLRSLHSYGSSAVVVVLLLHIFQTFLYGSYKGRRELLWLSGCVLFALMLGMAFTGYLLPWDQKAYFATAVGTNIASEVPFIGDFLKRMMRGGTDMGALTLSRFFVAHVLLLPAAIFGFIAMHVFFFRKAGAAGPIGENPFQPRQKTERFYPRQVLMDMGFALLLIAALGVLSYVAPVEVGPRANPAEAQYLPRPEWYYVPVFQWLKYWQGSNAFFGVVIVPSVVAALFVGLPFIDRRLERRPWKRPLAVSVFLAAFLSLVALGIVSYREDHGDPGVVAQLHKQQEETARFMNEPFEPETAGGAIVAVKSTSADPLVAKGKSVFEAQGCNACHGDGGVGTAAGPKLIGVASKLPGDKLQNVLTHPTKMMTAGGMTAVQLPDADMKALVSYVNDIH